MGSSYTANIPPHKAQEYRSRHTGLTLSGLTPSILSQPHQQCFSAMRQHIFCLGFGDKGKQKVGVFLLFWQKAVNLAFTNYYLLLGGERARGPLN